MVSGVNNHIEARKVLKPLVARLSELDDENRVSAKDFYKASSEDFGIQVYSPRLEQKLGEIYPTAHYPYFGRIEIEPSGKLYEVTETYYFGRDRIRVDGQLPPKPNNYPSEYVKEVADAFGKGFRFKVKHTRFKNKYQSSSAERTTTYTSGELVKGIVKGVLDYQAHCRNFKKKPKKPLKEDTKSPL